MQQTIESQKPELKVVKNLYQKLVDIRKQLTYLQKEASGQKGKYVDGATILSTIRPMIDEAGLLLIPNVLNTEITNITVVEGSENKEKVKQIVKSDMLYTWINADNPSEKLEVQFACVGMQLDISMAFGSALTYSERYFLLKFFNIPTDKDDPDTFENKVSKKTKGKGKIIKASTEFATYKQKEEYRTLVTPAEYAATMNKSGGKLPMDEYLRVKEQQIG